MGPKARIVCIVASVACWAAACCLPALHLLGKANTQGEQSTMVGLMAFIMAFFALLEGQFAWLGNVAWGVAMLLMIRSRHRGALIASAAAVGLAQHTWVLIGTEINGDEGGVKKYLVTALGLGFWMWVASFAIVAAASIAGAMRRPGPPPLPVAVRTP
jgi:hypothetical protein